MGRYIHEQADWPTFRYDANAFSVALSEAWRRQGYVLGQMQALGFALRQETELDALTLEVEKTSEIEGEYLDSDQVRSSVARRLGMDASGLPHPERDVEGVVEMMMDATHNFAAPLTEARLFDWHRSLFPTGRIGLHSDAVGRWRDELSDPMQVVSGRVGHQHIHFEAPAAERLNSEMHHFLEWFNADEERDGLVKAALAHLWFVTLHPFEDGNGRIARAVADMALARADRCEQRFYSMSAQIRRERKEYYAILERTQSSTLDVTEWLGWFVGCLTRTLEAADTTIQKTVYKANFWMQHGEFDLNERQRKMLNKLLDGFVGKLVTQKWAKMTGSSHDTANRDIKQLIDWGILEKEDAGGRSTSYRLK